MSEQYLATPPSVKTHLSRQAVEARRTEGAHISVQRSPMDERACRPGDPSCSPVAGIHRSLSSPVSALLRLQRQCGNRHVQRVLEVSRLAAGDADVASPALQRSIDGARGGGQALDSGVQSRMGQAFNADFSGVRIHTDAHADSLNRALNARAFTTGRDVFFRRGEYDPSSSSGRSLLAHELTHVMQQNPGSLRSKSQGTLVARACTCNSGESPQNLQTKMSVSRPGDVYEKEADQMAVAYAHWERKSGPTQAAGGEVQRKKPEDDEEEKKKMTLHRKEARAGAFQRQAGAEEPEEGMMLAKFDGTALHRQEAEEPEEM